MSPATKTQRWLDLIAFLAARRTPAAFEEVMEGVPPYAADFRDADDTALASLRRKFERDKDELRGLGIPIETVEYRINYGREQIQGYRLRSHDFYLPYLRLIADDASVRATGPHTFELRRDEARAAVDALHRVAELPGSPLRREARSAMRKLTFDLGPHLAADGPTDPSAPDPVRFLAPPGSEDLSEALRRLSDGLVRRKRVTFRYRAIRRDEASDRRVHPYGLLFQHSHWYLIGDDLDREAVRVFRLGRMEAPEVNTSKPGSPDYQVPDDFSLHDYAGRPPWALAGSEDEPVEVTVRFDFPRSLWAHRNRHGELIGEADDGSQIRRFPVQDTGPFLRWVLTLGGEARIESPEEMRQELGDLAARIGTVHGGKARGAEPEDADG